MGKTKNRNPKVTIIINNYGNNVNIQVNESSPHSIQESGKNSPTIKNEKKPNIFCRVVKKLASAFRALVNSLGSIGPNIIQVLTIMIFGFWL